MPSFFFHQQFDTRPRIPTPARGYPSSSLPVTTLRSRRDTALPSTRNCRALSCPAAPRLRRSRECRPSPRLASPAEAPGPRRRSSPRRASPVESPGSWRRSPPRPFPRAPPEESAGSLRRSTPRPSPRSPPAEPAGSRRRFPRSPSPAPRRNLLCSSIGVWREWRARRARSTSLEAPSPRK